MSFRRLFVGFSTLFGQENGVFLSRNRRRQKNPPATSDCDRGNQEDCLRAALLASPGPARYALPKERFQDNAALFIRQAGGHGHSFRTEAVRVRYSATLRVRYSSALRVRYRNVARPGVAKVEGRAYYEQAGHGGISTVKK